MSRSKSHPNGSTEASPPGCSNDLFHFYSLSDLQRLLRLVDQYRHLLESGS